MQQKFRAPIFNHSSKRVAIESLVWRVSKRHIFSTFKSSRANIYRLFVSQGDHRRRQLIVHGAPPVFTKTTLKFGKDCELNVDQRKACLQVIQAQDYALILGMPGTGKTTTIAYIIQLLVRHGKSVLISAYTHSALDNLLLKLRELGVEFFRFHRGSINSVAKELRNVTLTGVNSNIKLKQLEDLKAQGKFKVIGCTCAGTNNPLLQALDTFDYCIIDEATQLTLPIALGPLRFAKVFVLVGDHYQLPPLVRAANNPLYGQSLFKQLSVKHPEAVVELHYQYRMNTDIMSISNELVYQNRLIGGTENILNCKLNKIELAYLPKLKHGFISSQNWLMQVLNPSKSVVFLDTDNMPALDSCTDNGHTGGTEVVINRKEAKIASWLAHALVSCGVLMEEIGILTPYRSQVSTIRQELRRLHVKETDTKTIDKYQGKDKPCVIVSFARSNPKKKIGSILRDWRRLNVAFTRAKQKLLLIGSKSTLEGHSLFSKFFELVVSKGWHFMLPRDACDFYDMSPRVGPEAETSSPMVL